MTPLRDAFGLNDPDAAGEGDSARDLRARQKAQRAELQSGGLDPRKIARGSLLVAVCP